MIKVATESHRWQFTAIQTQTSLYSTANFLGGGADKEKQKTVQNKTGNVYIM